MARYCGQCGSSLAADTKFCSQCGTAVVGASPARAFSKGQQSRPRRGKTQIFAIFAIYGAIILLIVVAVAPNISSPFDDFFNWIKTGTRGESEPQIHREEDRVTIRAGHVLTLTRSIPAGTAMTVSFREADGYDIRFRIDGPGGKPILGPGRWAALVDSFTTSDEGEYYIVFDNSFSFATGKTITYVIEYQFP